MVHERAKRTGYIYSLDKDFPAISTLHEKTRQTVSKWRNRRFFGRLDLLRGALARPEPPQNADY